MPQFDEETVKSLNYDEAMVAAAAIAASSFAEENLVPALESVTQVDAGVAFTIPMLIPEDLESGDGRKIKSGALSTRTLPLPLFWQPATDSGHNTSYIVGRIDSIDRIEGGLGNAKGVFDVGGPYGREAARLVREGFLRGVSADLDQFEASSEDTSEEPDNSEIKSEKITISSARVMAATLVGKPSFECCFIMIDEEPTLDIEGPEMADGIYEEIPEDYEYQLAALAASAAPIIPPKSWFKDPGLTRATPLTITDDGKVFGHVAAWATSHIGMGRGVKPPRSASQYAYFRTGELRTDEGDIQVGQLTLAGGHASLQASAEEAIKHYDDTNSAVADVVAGEDQFGIWVAGALRPDVTPSQIRAFRASSPSGDWRPINGRLELVGVLAVNVPGFPVARAITASGGVPGALVAAGAAYLAEIKETDRLSDFDNRLASIERSSFSADIEKSRKRMASVLASRNSELAARVDIARNRIQSRQVREQTELSLQIVELKKRFNG